MIDPSAEFRRKPRAFTLVELLVVIGIISVLAGLLMPSLYAARRAAVRTQCLSNQRQIGAAIFLYAGSYGGVIPYGPKAPPPTSTNFYPGTGDVTNLLSLQSGAPVALGLLLKDYLSTTPLILFCPGADQFDNAAGELLKVGNAQAQGDYYYRHGSSDSLSDVIVTPTVDHIRLSNLGLNHNHQRISALVMDQDYIADPSLSAFGIYTRTSHERRTVNVLYSDGHAVALDNGHGAYTINPPTALASLNSILLAFEAAEAPSAGN